MTSRNQKLQLTPSQLKALSTARHLAITANAGSGKTRVLVTRYVDLFVNFPELTTRNILAITFTDSAAAELRTRISEEIAKRLEEIDRNDRATRVRLITLRDSLSGSFISTIHTFASRILRAYPVEANVDASFAIVTGADQKVMVEDTIARVFYSALDEAYQAKQETPILQLFRTLGRKPVKVLVETLLRNRARTATVRKNLLSKSDEEIVRDWMQEFGSQLSYATEAGTRDLLQEVVHFAKDNDEGKAAKSAVTSCIRAQGLFESASSLYYAACSVLTKDKSGINSRIIERKAFPADLDARVDQFVERVLDSKSLLEACPSSQQQFETEHTEYLGLMRSAFLLYDEVLAEYVLTKKEYGLLDFDDLIEYLQKLLEEPRIRAELREQFRFIMIDEYQDTDESQFRIAEMLTESFGPRNNLTIVGDPKQAIYTFRNADAWVFRQTADAIRSQIMTAGANEESMKLRLSPEEERGEIVLAETFRMSERPLAAINRLFSRVMTESEDVAYSHLVHGRETPVHGHVEWICAAKHGSTESDEGDPLADVSEAELIAKKIRWIVEGKDDHYFIPDEKSPRPARYEDIAILLRSRTSLHAIERALRKEEIPYTVAKGVGFFDQQEIVDITSYLTFLVSPGDDIALVAILRSPFFAVSDVELFQVAYHRSERRRDPKEPWSFWQQLQSYVEESESGPLRRAIAQLRTNVTLTGRTNSAFLIEKIYAETGIFATLIGTPNGAQKVANLEKFLSQARDSDQSGFSSIFDFVDRIKYLSDSEEQESQADLVDTRGAVKIMTVHAAKGLEFPIVIVPFLQKKFNFDRSDILDKDHGLYLSIEHAERKTLISEVIRRRSKANTIAEEKRIFYVALTRTRDHLILSSTFGKSIPRDSWLSWTCNAFGEPHQSADNQIQFSETISCYDGENRETTSRTIDLDVHILRSVDEMPMVEKDVAGDATKPVTAFYLEPLAVANSVARFSATQLLRFSECPTKYHLQYVLGLPEEAKLAYDREADEYSEQVRGPILGQVVHRLLDKISMIANAAGIDTERAAIELQNIFFSLRIYDERTQQKVGAEALKHVANFLRSDLSKRVLAVPTSYSEFELQVPLETGDTLYGIVDRLYLNADNQWTVLDYKTEKAGKKDSLDRYQFQLRFYSYLVHQLYPGSGDVRAILFYTQSGKEYEFTFTQKDFDDFESEVIRSIEEIRKNEAVPDLGLLEQNTSQCPNCTFFNGESCIVMRLEADRNASQVAELA